MNQPPPGYDDQSIIPRKQLKFLLGEFEGELIRIERIFRRHIPYTDPVPANVENQFNRIRLSADELGAEYGLLVEKLITAYRNFREQPNEEKLEKLFGDVRELQLMLAAA